MESGNIYSVSGLRGLLPHQKRQSAPYYGRRRREAQGGQPSLGWTILDPVTGREIAAWVELRWLELLTHLKWKVYISRKFYVWFSVTLAPRSSWGRSGAPVLMSVQPLVNPGPHTQSLRCVFNLWEIVLNMWFCLSFYLYDQFNFLRRITMVRFSPSTNTTRDILTVDKDFDECLSRVG